MKDPDCSTTLISFSDKYYQDQDSFLRLSFKEALTICEEEGLPYEDLVSSLLEFFPEARIFYERRSCLEDITFQDIFSHLGDTCLNGLLDGIGDATADNALLNTAGGLSKGAKAGIYTAAGIAAGLAGRHLYRQLGHAVRERAVSNFEDDLESELGKTDWGTNDSLGSLEHSIDESVSSDLSRVEDRLVNDTERDPEKVAKDILEINKELRSGSLSEESVIKTAKRTLSKTVIETARTDLLQPAAKRLGRDSEKLIVKSSEEALIETAKEVPNDINTDVDNAYDDFKQELSKFQNELNIKEITDKMASNDPDMLSGAKEFVEKRLFKYCADQDLLTRISYQAVKDAKLGGLPEDLKTTLDNDVISGESGNYKELIQKLVDEKIQALRRAGVEDAKELLSDCFKDIPVESIEKSVSDDLKKCLSNKAKEGIGAIKQDVVDIVEDNVSDWEGIASDLE